MDNNSQGILKLRKPLVIDDKQITELTYDFDNIPTTGIRDVMSELRKMNYIVAFTGSDPMYNLLMFGLAAEIHFHDILRLGVIDQQKASMLTMGFFGAGLEE